MKHVMGNLEIGHRPSGIVKLQITDFTIFVLTISVPASVEAEGVIR
jgi:hypothetical protein